MKILKLREGQQLLLYLQGNIFLTNANLYTIPHSFCAATKTIPDRDSVRS